MFIHLSVILFTGGPSSGGLCPRGSLSRRVPVQGESLSKGSLSRGDLCPEISVQIVVSVQGALCAGGLCAGKFVQGVSVQGVSVQGVSVQGASVHGVSVQGVSVPGVSVQGGLCPGVVRILQECTLVEGGLCQGDTPTTTVCLHAGGTHPTGMHSCRRIWLPN